MMKKVFIILTFCICNLFSLSCYGENLRNFGVNVDGFDTSIDMDSIKYVSIINDAYSNEISDVGVCFTLVKSKESEHEKITYILNFSKKEEEPYKIRPVFFEFKDTETDTNYTDFINKPIWLNLEKDKFFLNIIGAILYSLKDETENS